MIRHGLAGAALVALLAGCAASPPLRDGLPQSAPPAIELATTHEGRAALTTAIINSCSFAVLSLSEYRPTAWFGGLLALTMIVAFLAEVFILPATIVMAPRFFGGERARPARHAAT